MSVENGVCGGDPAPGKGKACAVFYTVDDKIKLARFREHETFGRQDLK